MDRYICAIAKNKISGLIHSIHLIDLIEKIKYSGVSTIGDQSSVYFSNDHQYDYILIVNKQQFLKILNTPYKDVFQKSINYFAEKFNIGIENFI